MKYLFIIVSSYYCVVHAISLQFKLLCRRIDTLYKQHLQKDCQFYRRTYTRRYFTENCKKIMAFCERYTDGRIPFGISQNCKKNYRILPPLPTGIPMDWYPVGISQRVAKQLRYFATIIDRYTNRPAIISDVYTDGFADGWHTFESAPVRSYRRICHRTWQNQCVCALAHNF
jgi:hypothetical protein